MNDQQTNQEATPSFADQEKRKRLGWILVGLATFLLVAFAWWLYMTNVNSVDETPDVELSEREQQIERLNNMMESAPEPSSEQINRLDDMMNGASAPVNEVSVQTEASDEAEL